MQLPMEFSSTIIAETVATLIGIFVGTLAALATERRSERRRKRRRARIILRSLSQELSEAHRALQAAKPAYLSTAWGKSFYLSTTAWETAMAGGDLSDIIGFELTDLIAAQYALLVRIRYYVDLMTQLWFAPRQIEGYQEIQGGFHRAILEAINQALNRHPQVIKGIKERL